MELGMRRLLVGAAMGLLAACGTGGGGGTDGGSNTCSTDANCGTGKVCHPVLKECITSCTSSMDCQNSAKTCARYDGTAGSATSPGFCQCSTDALCNGGMTGNLVCSEATKRCEGKCTSNGNCPSGYSCNSTSGQCTKGGTDGGMDGGMDAGTPCTGLGVCVYPEVCNFTSDHCQAGAACNVNNAQPDTCGYAGYCTSAANCAQVEKPTCDNFTPGTGRTPVFNPKTSTGPIIFYVDTDTMPPAASCFKGFYTHSVYLDVYRTDADWPAQLAAMPGAFYVRTDGTQQDITAGLPGSYYVPNGRTLRLRKYVCATTQNPISLGFYYTNGNEICAMTSGAVAGTTNCTSSTQCGNLTCNTGTGTCE